MARPDARNVEVRRNPPSIVSVDVDACVALAAVWRDSLGRQTSAAGSADVFDETGAVDVVAASLCETAVCLRAAKTAPFARPVSVCASAVSEMATAGNASAFVVSVYAEREPALVAQVVFYAAYVVAAGAGAGQRVTSHTWPVLYNQLKRTP